EPGVPRFGRRRPCAQDPRGRGRDCEANEAASEDRHCNPSHSFTSWLPDHGRLIETSTTSSPPTASDRTKPTPGAYHLSSPPDSSNDHSLVRRQFVKVPAGTVTVSPTATICPMSSAQFG